MKPLLAVDLGGSQLRVCAFDDTGRLRAKVVRSTHQADPGALLRTMIAVRDAAPAPPALAVVGVPGAVEYATGEARHLPNLPQWPEGVSAQPLADALGLPVLLANDADLAALGEHRDGAGQGVDDLVCVTVGTGIGVGVILGGHLVHGHWSIGESGHTIIDRAQGASLESLASGSALQRLAGEDAVPVTARALQGDAAARALLREVAENLALGVLNLVYCFMPQRVVIGGGLAAAGDLLLTPVREGLARAAHPISLRPEDVLRAQGGEEIGLLGARALGQDPPRLEAWATPAPMWPRPPQATAP